MKKNESFPLKKHAGRPDLVGEHPMGDTSQVIIIFIFLAVWFSDTFRWLYSTLFNDFVPLFVRLLLGTAIAIPALNFTRQGIRSVFVKKRERPMVIREGVFSLVRHPIYLGAILSYLSLVLYSLSLVCLFLWILITAFYGYLARYEEKALVRFFGDAYVQYQKDVPMLFPKIRVNR